MIFMGLALVHFQKYWLLSNRYIIAKAMKWICTLVGNRIYLRCFTSLIRSWTFIIHRRRFSHVKMDSIFSINFREFKKVAEVVKIWAAGLILLLLSTPAEAVNSSVNMRFFSAGEGKKYPKGNLCGFWPLGKKRNHLGKVHTIVEFQACHRYLPFKYRS